MPPEKHDYPLDRIGLDHAIDAGIFVPFTIQRLQDDPTALEAILQVRLRDIVQADDASHELKLRWPPMPVYRPPVQDHIVTEWAALGVACAVVFVFAGLRIQSVTMTGDAFDYWVSDGDREYALEVSGTLLPDLDARHRAKIQQLAGNPYGIDGYVVVVAFGQREVLFSFHPSLAESSS